jgi:hypothetical protein
MRLTAALKRLFCVMALLSLNLAGAVAQAQAQATAERRVVGWGVEEGEWGGGGGAGIIFATPDDAAVAFSTNLDYGVIDEVAVGPLLQLAFTGDLAQFGLSVQAKYGIPVEGTDDRGRITLQTGLGFVHADFRRDDTSWLVPLGFGYEHMLDGGQILTSTLLVNFTDLKTGGGANADVMPALMVGVQF